MQTKLKELTENGSKLEVYKTLQIQGIARESSCILIVFLQVESEFLMGGRIACLFSIIHLTSLSKDEQIRKKRTCRCE